MKLKSKTLFASFLILAFNLFSSEKKDFKFDFTPDEASGKEGCIAVNGKTIYNQKRGFGWAKEWGRAYGGRKQTKSKQPQNSLLQGSIGAPHTVREADFIVDLPNGVYEVELTAGVTSPTEGRKGICMALEGKAMIPPPGIGGWGVVSKRKVPVLVEDGSLNVKFFVCGEGGAQRLNLYSLSVSPVENKNKSETLAKKWSEAPDMNKLGKRKIKIGGKEYIEIARRNETSPERWISKYKNKKCLLYARNNPGDILDYSIPREREIITQIDAFASPGEVQPLYFGVYAMEDVKDVRIKFFPLSDGKAAIYPENIELFTVSCHPQSPTEVISSTARIAPELLEKNMPFDIKKGKTQPLYILVKTPQKQKPGVYKGKIRFAPQGVEPFDLEINFRVLPLDLKKPKGKVWHLYSDTARWLQMSPREMRKEIEDMASHGINSLKTGMAPLYGTYIEKNNKITNVDYGRIGEGLRYAFKIGMNGPLLISSTPVLASSLDGWRLDKENNSSHIILREKDENILKITNKNEKSVFHISQSYPADLPSGESIRLQAEYRFTGKGKAQVYLSHRTLQRVPYKKSIKLPLPQSNGKWQKLSVVSKIPNGYPENMASFNYTGGPGIIEIKNICLFGRDGAINHICNYQFARSFNKLDLNAQWPSGFIENYKNAVKAYIKGAEELGFNIYLEGKDEAGSESDISELKFTKEAGAKTWCNLSLPLAKKNCDILDAVCFYGTLLGEEKNGLKIIDSFHKKGKEVYVITSGTYAGQDYDLMPNRYGVGYFFWKSKADGTGIWTFQRSCGNPFDDFDSRYRDHLLVYPPRKKGGEPIPTIGWEGIREGWKDYCYINTLEKALSSISKNNPKRKQGKAVLDFIRKRIPWYDEFSIESFDNKEADKLRWLAAWTTMRLQGKSLALTAKKKTGKNVELKVRALNAKQEVHEQTTLCPMRKGTVKIDGKLDDEAWNNAQEISDFRPHTNGSLEPEVETRAYLMHDKNNIYLGFKCYEPNMDKLNDKIKERDGNVFADESIEIFLDTNNDEFSFYQMCLNSAGSKFDMKCAGGIHFGANIFNARYGNEKIRDQKWNGNWIVKTSRHQDRWEAEIAIPFSTVGRESDIWGFHLGRNRRIGKRRTYSNKAIGSFHQPEKFAKLALCGSRNGKIKLKNWKRPPFYYGINTARFEFDSVDGLKCSTEITDKNGGIRKRNGIIKEDFLDARYDLNQDDKMLKFLIADKEGNCLYNFRQPFQVSKPIEILSERQIFFKGKEMGKAEFKIKLHLSAPYMNSGKISINLMKEKSFLKSFKAPLLSSQYLAQINAGDLQEGFYSLKIIVSPKGEKELELEFPIIVIPHYINAQQN